MSMSRRTNKSWRLCCVWPRSTHPHNRRWQNLNSRQSSFCSRGYSFYEAKRKTMQVFGLLCFRLLGHVLIFLFHPEVTLCSLQDVKIQLLTGLPFALFPACSQVIMMFVGLRHISNSTFTCELESKRNKPGHFVCLPSVFFFST